MRVLRRVVVFDAADINAESRFWAGVLGGAVRRAADWHSVIVDGEWIVGVQHATNHIPPRWQPANAAPDEADRLRGSDRRQQQQQVHLDLHVDDLAAMERLAITFGGRQLQSARPPADNPTGEERFAVYASPAGHPVCFGVHP